MYFPLICLGTGTVAGHGICPGSTHMQGLSQPYPKLAGLSFFSLAMASAFNTSLIKQKSYKCDCKRNYVLTYSVFPTTLIK